MNLIIPPAVTPFQKTRLQIFNLIKDQILDNYKLYIIRDLAKFKADWSYSKRHLNYFKEYLRYFKPYLPKDEAKTLIQEYTLQYATAYRNSPAYIESHNKASRKYETKKRYKSQIEKEAQSFDKFSKKLIDGKIQL